MFIFNNYIRVACFLSLSAFTFLTQAANIEFFSPSGEVKKIRQVSVRFSEQMVAFGEPNATNPFNITCPAEGQGRWADQRNWIYDFNQDLPAGISCSFTVKKDLASLAKDPVKNNGAYTFTTGGPAIMQSEPREGSSYIDENQIFILGLDAPAILDTVQKNAYCQAEGINEQIPVRIVLGKLRTSVLDWRSSFMSRYFQIVFKNEESAGHPLIFGFDERGSDREKFLKLRDSANSPIVVLQCQRSLPNGVKLSLVWGQGIKSVSGLTTSQPQVLAFTTRPVFEASFSCDRVNADANCIPVLPLTLRFSAPITLENAKQIKLESDTGLNVFASIPESDKKAGFVEYIQFPTPLPEKTKFKIKLPEVLTDDAGRTLSNASRFPLEVQTDENPPLAKFSANFGILELNGSGNTPPLLPITLRNVEAKLAGNMSQTRQKSGGIPANVLHGDADINVIDWLQRLQNIDSGINPDTQEWDEKRGPGKISIFEKNEPIRAFTVPKPLGEKAFEVVGIPLPEPGFYVVELASPRLGNALLAENRPYYAHAATLVTNMAVHFKQGRESSLVWVTSLDQGKPVVGANVAVRDCKGKIYFTGSTDAQGLLQISKELPPLSALPECLGKYDRQYFVTAKHGRDFSFVFSNWNEGIALWRFNAYEGGGNGTVSSHAILDRTLLRAGETVHMKLIVRGNTATGFEIPRKKLPKNITLLHQGSEEEYKIPVTWDKKGIATVDWDIPQDAKYGFYHVLMPNIVGNFRVESFRVPSMKAIVQPAEAIQVNVDQVSMQIQVNYLSGGGASFLPVKLRGQLAQKIVSFPDYDDFTFANGSVKLGVQKAVHEPWNSGEYELSNPEDDYTEQSARMFPKVTLSTQEFKLDAAGSGNTTFSKLPKSEIPQDIRAELEYQDPNGEMVTAASQIPLWPSQLLVGIKPDGWMASADHLKFQALVVDINGNPKQGEKVAVKAMQREYFSHRRRLIGGFYAFDNHNEIKAIGEICKGVTDNKGMLMCDVKAPASGNIILQAETADSNGNMTVANREVWVAGNTDWWFDASDNDRIDLLPEKKQYEPGSTARFQIRMPFKEADVLVTIEREGILDSFVTHLTRTNPTIEIPVKDSYSPNIFVSALVIRGRVNDIQPTAMIDLGKPSFKMGLAEIKVGWQAHELKVKVSTDKPIYHVREQAKIMVDVKRIDGSNPPRDSEITLVAVDEGLLELRPNETWKLLDAMMKRRGIEVSTSTAQMQVIGKRHFGRKALPAGGGGGAGNSARELFDTLLFWQARVKLDDAGHAEATIPLNDSLTSFRIVAIANSDTDLFGTGSASIQSTQDLILISGLPKVVREQDKFQANFTVRNAVSHSVEALVTARLTTSDKDAIPLTPITVNLPSGESKSINWEVVVPTDSESLNWEVIVRVKGAAEAGDHLKVSQTVISAVPVRTLQAAIFQLEKPESISIRLPEGALTGRGGVQVAFHKQIGNGLTGVQEFMTRYPYSCMEQQVSQSVALQDEGRWNKLMKKLPSYLDQNGLVKYFPVMLHGDDILSSYLVAVSNEAGYKIPETLLEKIRNGLIGFVEGRVTRYSALPTTDLNIRKISAIEALARTGSVESKWLDSITIEPNLWPTSAVIDWLSILHRKPEISKQSARFSDAAQQIIRSRLNFQGTTLGFSTERNDTLWWLMINGDVNANRALLSVFELPNWQPEIPKLVTGSLGRQLHGHWNTTVANAWGVLAMKKFSDKFESTPVTGNTFAQLGNQQFEENWQDKNRDIRKLLSWPTSTTPMNLSHKGNGKPWATLQSLAALPLKQPLFSGFQIDRKLTMVSQKIVGEWHKGDVARVHINIEAQTDMTWVVVNDPIPSGSVILGTGLGGDSSLLTQDEKKQGWVFPAFEERTQDSFRAYYRFVPKGIFSVEYTVRLNNDGTFQLPPTRVEAMYAPEIFGEFPNETFIVKH